MYQKTNLQPAYYPCESSPYSEGFVMLVASTSYVQDLTDLFKSLLPVSTLASLTISDSGILVTAVDKARTCSASTLLTPTLFASFDIEEDTDITISLKSLTSCLQMFSDWGTIVPKSVQTSIGYGGGACLNLKCGLDSIRANCEIQIYDTIIASEMGPQIAKDAVCIQLICSGSIFAEIMKVLERSAVSTFKVTGRSTPIVGLDCLGESPITACLFEFSESSVDNLVVEQFCEFSYDFKALLKLKESLKRSTKISMRCDRFGTMNVQMIHEIDDITVVVEYTFGAQEELA